MEHKNSENFSSRVSYKRIRASEYTFKGRNFREFENGEIFGINFRESIKLENFAGINFLEFRQKMRKRDSFFPSNRTNLQSCYLWTPQLHAVQEKERDHGLQK